MELLQVQLQDPKDRDLDDFEQETIFNKASQFIEANTIESSLSEIRDKHIIPVFVKDNEATISEAEFIENTYKCVQQAFPNQQINAPNVRLSHPIKGRIAEAKYKAVTDLQEHEKTIYYERCAFIIEVPSYTTTINGNQLSLSIGGVKSYSVDNLNARKGTDEHFKTFIGFQNKVCTNLCISTDGLANKIAVKSIDHLQNEILQMIYKYDAQRHLNQMQLLNEIEITEQQFAQLLGRLRMYPYLQSTTKKEIPALLFNDTQINAVCRDYYNDKSFCKQANGNINLWKLYNLFTGSNKSSYIDSFLERGLNAYKLIEHLYYAETNKQYSWFLN